MSLFASLLPLLQAAPSATPVASGGGSSSFGMLIQVLPIVALIAVFYFLVLRPQNKKQKETKKMLEALKKGDKVITIGGVHGVVSSVKENTVIVKVDENCKLEFLRSAISTVTSRDDAAADKSDTADKAATESEKK